MAAGLDIILNYRIFNPGSASVTVILGGSVRPAGADAWTDDPDNASRWIVPPGQVDAARVFHVPGGAVPGAYDLAWELFGEDRQTRLAAAVESGFLSVIDDHLFGESWLDEPFVPWNAPGMAVRRVPEWEGLMRPVPDFCLEAGAPRVRRPPEMAEDQAVLVAGWSLTGAYTAGWGVKVVEGFVGQDHNCQPGDYFDFVFVDGKFAGSTAPVPMGHYRSRQAGLVI